MGDNSEIQWCDATWNPVRGCSRVSPGCGGSDGGGCYAERQAHRFSGLGGKYEGLTKLTAHGPRWTGDIRTVPELLEQPLRWRRPRRIFVNSMSDLFHEKIPDDYIAAVFGVMAACPWHTFQVLTKRAERMNKWFRWIGQKSGPHGPYVDHVEVRTCTLAAAQILREKFAPFVRPGARGEVPWPLPNVHVGVSVENRAERHRIDTLRQIPAALRFLSLEPLLEDLGTLDLSGIGWVIAGGESGPGARRCDVGWIRDIVRQCREANVPVFVKQLGAKPGHDFGDERLHGRPLEWQELPLRDRKGGDPSEWPEYLGVRELP